MGYWGIRKGAKCALTKNGIVWKRRDSRIERQVPVVLPDIIRFCDIETWNFCRGKEDSKTATLADFTPAAVGEMENHYLTNTEMGPVGRYPSSLDFFKRIIRSRNLVWTMAFGADRYSEREEALGLSALRYEGSPEFFTTPFFAAIWERMTIDYVQKVTEGVRCLTQLGRKSDGLEELNRLARHAQEWKFPHTFCMESSNGYWGRYVLPQTDLEAGISEYRVALPKVIASFGVMDGVNTKVPADAEFATPKGNGGER